MTHDEAINQLYGSKAHMKAVLDQRYAIARDTREALQRLQRRMHEEFPPIDSIGSHMDILFNGNLFSLKMEMRRIEEAIKACDPPPLSEIVRELGEDTV